MLYRLYPSQNVIFLVGTPIHWACVELHHSYPWLMFLTSAAIISPLSYLQDGATALHLAAQNGKANVVRLLIEAGAQLDIQRTVCAILALSNAESIGLLR